LKQKNIIVEKEAELRIMKREREESLIKKIELEIENKSLRDQCAKLMNKQSEQEQLI
jgi:hypothetical protein